MKVDKRTKVKPNGDWNWDHECKECRDLETEDRLAYHKEPEEGEYSIEEMLHPDFFKNLPGFNSKNKK